MCRIRCAVPHGTVLFSTMMVPGRAHRATSLAAASNEAMLVARPAPRPNILVGVLTARKMRSALAMPAWASPVKIRLGARVASVSAVASWPARGMVLAPSRATRTTSSSPGSWMGRCGEFHCRMRRGSLSTTSTRMEGLCKAMMAAVGPPSPRVRSVMDLLHLGDPGERAGRTRWQHTYRRTRRRSHRYS